MSIQELHLLFLKYPIISTDTRNISSNSLFFALKGENFDGNTFAHIALNKGAAYAIVDDAECASQNNLILVNNVLECLQSLASYHRTYCKAKVIALTGSNGKTTTKELIHAVLSKKYNTIATKGNLNNHIGVPLTLLNIKKDTDIAIVEMGANHLKEIEFLTNITNPDFGYITNFGKAHLEGFGSQEGIIKGKSELYDHLIANNKHIFLNADDPVQINKLGTHIKKIGYSTDKPQYFNIKLKAVDPLVSLEVESTIVNTQLIGEYNFTNCCAAILIGKYFNVALSDIKNALESYVPKNNRSQLIEKNGFQIILDAYNANPTSMVAALDNLSKMEGESKTVFLGDMFELGETAEEEHQHIANLVEEIGFDKAFLIGEHFNKTSTKLLKFPSFKALVDYLAEHTISKGIILIKGSRGMALERLLDLL